MNTETETPIEQLVEYIQQHGVDAYHRGTRLYATDDFMFCGIPHSRTVEIAPRMEAVREWLGY